MATASAIGGPVIQLFDNNGNPAASYQLFIYTAGTTGKITTWTDVNEATPNTNPIILDSAGRCTVFLSPGSAYKFVLATPTDTDPPSSPVWTRDNIQAVPLGALTATDVSVTAVAGEALTAGQVVYEADGSGGTTAGRWYKADPANVYSSTGAGQLGMVTSSIGSGSTGVVLKDGRVTGLSGLVAGTLYYINTAGALTSTAPTNARPVGVAESTTVLIFGPWAGTTVASSTLMGVITTGAQSIAGLKTMLGGLGWNSGSSLLDFAFGRLTSDFVKNNNTTLGNVTGLSFPIGASQTWVYLFLMHGNAQAAADYKFAVTFPAGVTAVRYGAGTFSGQPLPGAGDTLTAGVGIACGAAGADELVTVYGLVRNGANAGTVQLQCAQFVLDASNLTIYTDSCVLAVRVA